MRSTRAPLAAAVIAGLMLGSCGDDVGEPEYGVPLTSGPDDTTTAATDGTETDGTDGTDGSTGATSSPGEADTTPGEADYGVVETTTDSTSG